MRFKLLCLVALIEVQAFALPIHRTAPQLLRESLPIADAAYNYEGIVSLSGCSGALIRFESSKDNDKGLILSNGHCVSRDTDSGYIEPDTFVYRDPEIRSFTLLAPNGTREAGRVQSTQLLYGTMTGTDISIFELKQTYAEIKQNYKTNALVLDTQRPSVNDDIEILSGYWRRGYACHIEKFVFKVLEDAYTWTDSIRYSDEGCDTIHGTSGAPILSKVTRKVVGINNTGNDSGGRCTMNNPCEVDEQGQVFFQKGINYGQQTYQIYSCLDKDGKFDISVEGCQLLN